MYYLYGWSDTSQSVGLVQTVQGFSVENSLEEYDDNEEEQEENLDDEKGGEF